MSRVSDADCAAATAAGRCTSMSIGRAAAMLVAVLCNNETNNAVFIFIDVK